MIWLLGVKGQLVEQCVSTSCHEPIEVIKFGQSNFRSNVLTPFRLELKRNTMGQKDYKGINMKTVVWEMGEPFG